MGGPNRVGVDHQVGAMPALIEAARAIDTNLILQAGRGYSRLEAFEHLLGISIEGAEGAVGANKNMLAVLSH